MKKLVSMFLVVVLLLCLVACDDSKKTAENAIVGEWICTEEALEIRFNKDKTGILIDDGLENEINWKYDAELECYIFTYGVALAIRLQTVNGIEQFVCDGYTFVRKQASDNTDNKDNTDNTDNKDNTDNTDQTAPLLFHTFSGDTVINKDRLHECVDEVVELTTENWREYIQIITYSKDYLYKDIFDDSTIITETIEQREYGMKSDRYYTYDDVMIELKHIETGTVVLEGVHEKPLIDSSTTLDDYECLRIKGKVYFLTFPEEAIEWNKPFENNLAANMQGTIHVGSEWLWNDWYINAQTNFCDTSRVPFSEYLNQ